ncbi:MAG: GatB/YqeY domain-containing protein [Gammaproteobacteria bacterium]|nr:GatB/YqeY domain-containing protein [Gammaproteobacteria bacterium]MBK8131502.1 GatB/YqeY domain-containing protein [Gammaproteobacteria bacterium]
MSESSLKSRLKDAMKTAMRARDRTRLDAIRLMLAEIQRIEVDERTELDDARVLAVLDKMTKQRRDSITQYRSAGREELAAQELAEIEIIAGFLPTALTAAEIAALIEQAIASSGASSARDMGKVMALLKPELQGRADIGAVSAQVKTRLG